MSDTTTRRHESQHRLPSFRIPRRALGDTGHSMPFFIFAFIALAIGQFFGVQAKNSSGAVATGVVNESVPHRHAGDGTESQHHVTAEWPMPGGGTHTKTFHLGDEPDETIDIYFNPDKPDRAATTSPARNRLYRNLLWGFAAILVSGPGVRNWWIQRRRRRRRESAKSQGSGPSV